LPAGQLAPVPASPAITAPVAQPAKGGFLKK
ncbi:pilus assembly protein PilL, partial [Escherichia coli]